MTRGIFEGDITSVTKIYHQLLFENISLKNIVSGLMDQLYLELTKKKNLGEAELIWIYESLAKETVWIFSSLVPEKSIEVLLYKITLRRSFFNSSKKREEPTTAAIAPTPISTVAPKVLVEKTWDGFLAFLAGKSPASASNLEQGNLTSPLRFKPDQELYIDLGFGFSSLVFLDYLRDPEVFQKLQLNLAEFFEIDKSKIFLELKEVAPTEDFVSRADIKEKEAESDQFELVENIKSNPMLKEAEKIFNVKVDKVIIEPRK
jgi:DNA polymerase-3 subunit gamma/tau